MRPEVRRTSVYQGRSVEVLRRSSTVIELPSAAVSVELGPTPAIPRAGVVGLV
jgi:hypothetical protein